MTPISPRPFTLSCRAPLCALGLVFFAAIVTGCGKTPSAEATGESESAPAVSVTSVKVGPVKSPTLLQLTGTLKGSKEAELAANVAGKVTKSDVERGQHIKQGDLIAVVDVSAAQLALAEARVGVEASKKQEEINKQDCERYEKLRQSGVVSALEYDQVVAKCQTAPLNVEAAEARQKIAAKNVGDGHIRSPFTGVVTDTFVEVGEYVQPSSKVVSLAEVDSLSLLFSVPEKNYPQVRVGAVVLLRVAAYGDIAFTGTVTHISGAVRSTRDVLVEANVDNPEGKLLPGMFADIDLSIGEEELPAVPQAATFEENGKLNVLVVKDGQLIQRVIQPAPQVGLLVPVRHGVSAGEMVVATYDPALKNGQRVK